MHPSSPLDSATSPRSRAPIPNSALLSPPAEGSMSPPTSPTRQRPSVHFAPSVRTFLEAGGYGHQQRYNLSCGAVQVFDRPPTSHYRFNTLLEAGVRGTYLQLVTSSSNESEGRGRGTAARRCPAWRRGTRTRTLPGRRGLSTGSAKCYRWGFRNSAAWTAASSNMGGGGDAEGDDGRGADGAQNAITAAFDVAGAGARDDGDKRGYEPQRSTAALRIQRGAADRRIRINTHSNVGVASAVRQAFKRRHRRRLLS